ncbi:MAG TPA: isoprenylcysteine carboxylmethyltransferase family protein [Rhodothermales bacterium]
MTPTGLRRDVNEPEASAPSSRSGIASSLLFLRAALWTVLFPGVLGFYIPWRFFGVREGSGAGAAGIVGLLLAATGTFILLSAIVEFARRGRGTLSPVDPPSRLVIVGPYRWVRNPMYAGVLFVLVGELMIASSIALLVYATGFFVVTNTFIARFEEPYLRRTFGEQYETYLANVRRWIPRIRPWRGGVLD